jgi:hypothetical protein
MKNVGVLLHRVHFHKVKKKPDRLSRYTESPIENNQAHMILTQNLSFCNEISTINTIKFLSGIKKKNDQHTR